MRLTDGTPLRVLLPLTAVLLAGVVTAAAQQNDAPSQETVLPTSPTRAATAVPTRATTPPPVPASPAPSKPPSVAPTTPVPAVVPTTAPPATVPPTVPPSVPVSPSPTRSPSPAPFDPGPGTSGQTSLDGVRLEVQVDRSTARDGDLVRVTTVITNTRPTPIVYRSTCPTKAVVLAATGANAQPSVSWSGDRQSFKDLALAGLVGAGNAFAPPSQVATGKPPTCPTGAPGLVDLAPQRSITEQHAWKAGTAYDSAYDGQAPVTASFSFALERTLTELEFSTVESSAPLRLIGEGSGIVPPTVAVDAALSIPRFAEYIDEGDSAVWQPPYAPGSQIGASVVLTQSARPTYTITLTRPDGFALVRVLADTGTPISITVS
jgi:hypothetical protein